MADAVTARIGRPDPGAVLLVVVGVLVVFLALYPIGWLLYGSVRTGAPWEGGEFTLANFGRAYSDPEVVNALRATLMFAAGQTVGAVAIGTWLAWVVVRTNTPARGLIEFLTLILFLFPLIMAVFAWTILLSPRAGIVNAALAGLFGLESAPFDIYSMGGMIFVQSLYVAPLAFLIVAPALASIDPSMEEAARMSGAGPLRVFATVTLPLAVPAIASASILLFIIGLESFDVPQLLGAQRGIFTFPSLIYHAIGVRFPADYGLGTALAVGLLAPTAVLVLLYRRLVRNAERFQTVRGKGMRPRRLDLGRWRWASFAACMVFFAVTVAAPMAVLLLGSFLRFFGRITWEVFDRLTWANWPRLLSHPQLLEGLANSLLLATVGGAICVLLAALVGYVATKTRLPGRSAVETAAMLPIAFPATVLGLALLWAWIAVPLPIYGTIFILGLAYVTRYLPIALRTVSGGLVQLSDEFDEAARMSGARRLRVLTTIVLPLLRPALAAAWLLMFMIFIRELGMSVLLVGTRNPVLSVVLFDYYQSGELGLLAAASVMLMALIIAVVAVARWIFGLRFDQFGTA